MASIALRNPLGRMFNGAGRAGQRRLLVIASLATTALVVVFGMWLSEDVAVPPSTLAKAPKADALPGGPHSTPSYSDLATRHDRDVAARAEAAGQSSVATMPGSETAIKLPPPPAAPRPTQAIVAPPSPRTAPTRAMAIAGAPAGGSPRQPPKPDDSQTKAYTTAINSLLAGWGGKAQFTDVLLEPEHDTRASGGGVAGNGIQQGGTVPSAAATQPVPNAARLAGRAGHQVLMPAGRGVYGRTVLAANSDHGGSVVVEALSGPIISDRMTGTFEKREDRLVIKLDSITLQDGTQQHIDAVVVAPDSMETAVASDVDPHYVSRFVLPVAAAFVSGLGQAIEQSSTTFVASPLGGGTGFTHLNIGQQLGVGAGVAGAQLGTLLKDAAPKGPTVSVKANVDVGVMFLAPLVVGEN